MKMDDRNTTLFRGSVCYIAAGVLWGLAFVPILAWWSIAFGAGVVAMGLGINFGLDAASRR